MMIGVDFDWTDAGDAEDHACKLEAISERAGNRGRYQESTELDVAAQCIRGLAEENANLKAENEALREAVKQEVQSASIDDYGEMMPCLGWSERLDKAIGAHDKEGK